jgi:hypothetical protein
MILAEEIPLSQHDVLEAHHCKTIRDEVLSLRPHWIQRGTSRTFFTLGTASYLDATKETSVYLDLARKANPILEGSFAWLYELVRCFLEQLLGDRFFYDAHYALPGFHVFLMNGGDRSGDKAAARAHFDLQWSHAIPGHKPTGTVSFTLPIELPSGGSSMEIWPTRYQDAIRMRFTATEYASEHASQSIPYVLGRMVVHDGFVLHAIGGSRVAAPEGYRITLQGHGVRMDNGWLLYW